MDDRTTKVKDTLDYVFGYNAQGKPVPDMRPVLDALALLTAEPEPCEDVIKSLIDELKCCCPGTGFYVSDASSLLHSKKAYEIVTHASQVADKRAEELRAKVETLRALCSEAYGALQTGTFLNDLTRRMLEALDATEPKQ